MPSTLWSPYYYLDTVVIQLHVKGVLCLHCKAAIYNQTPESNASSPRACVAYRLYNCTNSYRNCTLA